MPPLDIGTDGLERALPVAELAVFGGELTVVFSPRHGRHSGQLEILDQQFVPSFETPSRAEAVMHALRTRGLLLEDRREIIAPDLLRAHTSPYINALSRLTVDLERSDRILLPATWPGQETTRRLPPEAELGIWARDVYTSFGNGTLEAAIGSVGATSVALQTLLIGETRTAFALGRPPHHHAGTNFMGGYCYLNGTAIAALEAYGHGMRVAVIDVDYHHGNGTQQILYDKPILYSSLHASPEVAFPHYSGWADEIGQGSGEGFNLNVPLSLGTGWDLYSAALAHVIDDVQRRGIDLLIGSLGVDTFVDDPIGKFQLQSADFARLGAALSRIAVPTLIVMEGGYAVDELGQNVVNVLLGLLGG